MLNSNRLTETVLPLLSEFNSEKSIESIPERVTTFFIGCSREKRGKAGQHERDGADVVYGAVLCPKGLSLAMEPLVFAKNDPAAARVIPCVPRIHGTRPRVVPEICVETVEVPLQRAARRWIGSLGCRTTATRDILGEGPNPVDVLANITLNALRLKSSTAKRLIQGPVQHFLLPQGRPSGPEIC